MKYKLKTVNPIEVSIYDINDRQIAVALRCTGYRWIITDPTYHYYFGMAYKKAAILDAFQLSISDQPTPTSPNARYQ